MTITKEDFKKLADLQNLDNKLDALQASADEVPEQIAAKRTAVEQEQTRLNEFTERSKALQVQKKTKEGEMAQKEELIRKHQTELNSVKTNEAFKALLKEIEDDKTGVGVLETEILTLMEDGDKVSQDEKALKKELAGISAEAETEIKTLEAKKAELEKQHASESAARQQLVDSVPPEMIKLYEATRQRRAGIAVAQVVKDTCLACHMRLPPQTVINVKKGRKIVVCNSCQRILYDCEPTSASAA